MLMFFSGPLCRGDKIALSAEQQQHLKARRCLETNMSIECSDGTYRGIGILRVEKKSVFVEIEQVSEIEDIQKPHLTLYCAVLKPDRMSWLIEKATELGVEAICPFFAERSQHHYWSAKSLQHYEQVVIAACTQSERWRPLKISPPQSSLNQVMKEIEPLNILKIAALCPREFEQNRSLSLEKSIAERLGLFIGPEGGWTEKEIAILQQYANQAIFYPYGLLRAETAALTLSAHLLFQQGIAHSKKE